jgi:hypothetical protein
MDIRDNAVKVYKDTGWVWFEVIFLIAFQALFVYFMFTSDLDLWLYVVLSVALIISITHFFDIKKIRNTIAVYPDSLQIEHTQKMQDASVWKDVGTVEIQWSQIKRISVEGLYGATYYYMIIELQNGKSYRFTVIEPTRFYMKRQLKKYHKQYK